MTRLDEIRARASILLEEPSNLSHETARNYLYLLSRVQRLEGALRFYADETNWSPATTKNLVSPQDARAALEEGEERG